MPPPGWKELPRQGARVEGRPGLSLRPVVIYYSPVCSSAMDAVIKAPRAGWAQQQKCTASETELADSRTKEREG